MIKRAISKNYFHWEPSIDGRIYDQRLVNKYLKENQTPEESALDPEDIDTKILVYEDRVKTWFLDIAKKLKKNNEAGFVILSIAIAYIEGNQQFREGKTSNKRGRSPKFFIRGMRRIFNKEHVAENILKEFYHQVRCGLFHNGMTGNKVSISGQLPVPIRNDGYAIDINPHKFLDKIISDFKDYIIQLKNPSNLKDRENFEKRYNLGEGYGK